MTLPLTKLSPFYPGQWGVSGSDDPLGLRSEPQGLVYYVDGSHPNATDSNDGTDPNEPFATIQAAITKNNATIDWAAVPPYTGVNWIIIAPGEYAENLTPPYYCKVIGLGLATGGDVCVHVHPAAGSAVAGTGLACYWYNIRFTTDTAAPILDFGVCNSCVFDSLLISDGNPGLATVGLDMTDAGGTKILDCQFIGNSNPLTIGIRSTGDFYGCVIKGCQIEAVTTGIHLSDGAGLTGMSLITENNIAYPVNGIVTATAGPMVTHNWIAASVDAISHPDANRTIDNHTIVAGAGAIETVGT